MSLRQYNSSSSTTQAQHKTSAVQLHLESDATYLVANKPKSMISGYFECSNIDVAGYIPRLFLKAPIRVECKLFRHVVKSAAKAETAALFSNYETGLGICNMHAILGQTQLFIPV